MNEPAGRLLTELAARPATLEAYLGMGVVTNLSFVLAFTAWMPMGLLDAIFPALSAWIILALAVLPGILFFALGVGSLRKISVGLDGVALRSTWRRARFIGYASVRALRLHNSWLELVHHDGSTTRLGRRDRAKTTAALRLRIEETLTQFQTQPRVPRQGLLAEQHAEPTAWQATLREALHDSHYRGAAITREQLLAFAEDVQVDPERRAAAIPLLNNPAPEETRRLRVVAQSTASPRVRIAAEQVASGDDLGRADVATRSARMR